MILLPEDRSEWWAPQTPLCFSCSGDLSAEPATVYWHLSEGHLELHSTCAAILGAHLIADAREADLATNGIWTNRVRRVFRASLLRQEHTT